MASYGSICTLEAICDSKQWPRPTYSVWKYETASKEKWEAEVVLDCLKSKWSDKDSDKALEMACFMLLQNLKGERTLQMLCHHLLLDQPQIIIDGNNEQSVEATIHCGPFSQIVVDAKDHIETTLTNLNMKLRERHKIPPEEIWITKVEMVRRRYSITIKLGDYQEEATGYIQELLCAKLALKAKEAVINPLIKKGKFY